MAAASLQFSQISSQPLERAVGTSKGSEWARGNSVVSTKQWSFKQRSRGKASTKAAVATTAGVRSQITSEDRLKAMESDPAAKAYRITEVDAAVQKDFLPATVLAVADIAPSVRQITIEAEISREFVPIDKAYTKPGQSVLVHVPGSKATSVHVASPPFESESNWRVLYKLRGDIPAGTTKSPQFALSVRAPLDLFVSSTKHPALYKVQPGQELELGPFQPTGLDLRPIMFLSRFPTLLIFARGEGIATARALIEATDVGSLFLNMRSDVRLFYSERSPSQLAYKDRWAKWEALNVKIRPTVDSSAGEAWEGWVGSFAHAFDEDDLEYDPELTGAVVCGDRKSNEAALRVLKDAGVDRKQVLVWEA